jgi:hypothetical protein
MGVAFAPLRVLVVDAAVRRGAGLYDRLLNTNKCTQPV